LAYILVVEFHTEIRNNSVLVVLLVDIHGENIVVGKSGNQLEEMHGVGANHDFIGDAFIRFEFVGMQDNTHQHCVGFVEINDFHTVLGECDGCICQNILEGSC